MRYIAAAAAVVTFCGCAHVRPVSLDASSVASVDSRIRHRSVVLVLREGRSFQAQDVHLTLDSTFWRVRGLSGMRATATSNVTEISIKSHIRGAVDGLIIGFLVGAPWGAELIDNPNGPTSRFANRMEAGLAGGVQGGILGLPIGAIVGSRIRFRLRPPQ